MKRKEEIRWEVVPEGIVYCPQEGCSKAPQCLHYLAWYYAEPTDLPHRYYSTSKLSVGEGCEQFSSAELVQRKRGFTRGLSNVAHGKASALREAIMKGLGVPQASFYRLRSGEKLLTAEQERVVTQLFVSSGIAPDEIYDDFVEVYDVVE